MDNDSYIEKRVYPRFPVMIPAVCSVSDLPEKFNARTHDISVQGLGLVTDEQLTPGSLLDISLHMVDTGEDISRKGTVVWSSTTPNHKFRAGIKLENGYLQAIPLVLRTIYKQRPN